MAPWTDRHFEMGRKYELGLHVRTLAAEEPIAGTILYIHGLGESALCFERLITEPRLAHWGHIAPDLVGYGKSMWGSGPLSLERHAGQLDRLLERSEPDPLVVVSHSMGGVIGILFGEKYPGRVRALINVEGNISMADCHYSRRAADYLLDDWLAHGIDELIEGLFHGVEKNAAALRPYCASIQMCDPRAFHRNSIELVEASVAEDLATRMAAIAAPSIYLYGSPHGSGTESRQLLFEADVKTFGIKDSGHWPFLDQHEAFVDNLLLLLGQIAPGG